MSRLVEVEGRRIPLTNLDKVLWPRTGTTKAELIEHYLALAPVLLPHLARRPVTTRRFPDGVDAAWWHQNECSGEPHWFPVFETSGRGGRRLRFCMVDGPAALVWLANRAAIELHPFLWTIDAPREPTQLVLDLDPGPPAGPLEAAEAALVVRPLLEELGLRPLVKSSGSLGLHVHAPLVEPLDGKSLARRLGEVAAAERPDLFVTEVWREARQGRVYLDWLQNDPSRQTVAPYSLRGVERPTVAAPLRWEEVEEAVAERRPDLLLLAPEDVVARVERDGDLFAPLLRI